MRALLFLEQVMSQKILKHPDNEEIVKRLLNGESVKEIEEWLRKKYPRKRSHWVSYATLQVFRKNHLHLEGEVLDDIKYAKKKREASEEQIETRALLSGSNAYQQKINEIVSNHVDTNRKILEMMALVSSRIEFYYNMMQSEGGIKEDRLFIELLNTQRGLVQDWKKYVEGVADQRIEHNINISVVNEQLLILKNIVFEVLQELDPSLIPIFIEKVNSRLFETQYESPNYKHYQLTGDVIDVD